MRPLVAGLALFAASCSALVKVHECDVDSDCFGGGPDGGTLYCTDDHLCVGAVPDYRLCSVSIPADGALPSGAFVIGGLYRTSGGNDINGHSFRQAADLAAQEFRAANYNVAHVVCDTAGDPVQAARAYSVVIERFGAKIVVGPDTSAEVLEIAKTIKSVGVPIVSPAATNPSISGLDDNNLVWRTCGSDNLQAKVLAQIAPPTPSTKLDIVFESDNPYASGLKDAFIAAWSAVGGAAQPAQGFPTSNSAGLTTAVETIAADHPGYALLLSEFSAPQLTATVANASGLATTRLLMSDSAKTPSLWSLLSGNYSVLTRVHGVGPANPDPIDPSGAAFAVFSNKYRTTFGEDPSQTAFVSNAYDAFYVAAFAGLPLSPDKRTPPNIVANLGRLSTGTALSVVVGANGITTGVTGLMTGNINLVGTSGPIDFDSNGDVVTAPIEKWSVAVPTTASTMPMFKTDAIVTP